ncbi:MAG: flagellar biosynthesis protein FlhB [Hyphomicrobiales bacterium]|nr:MAG: flagellar biosynthesis protein FlhB [Hyphomicrobiales bacterium]
MAEHQDQSEKTEEPTQKKLDDAHKKGDVAKSQEVTVWFALLAITMMVMLFSGDLAASLSRPLSGFLANAHDFAVGGDSLRPLFAVLGSEVAKVMMVPMGLLMAAALAGNLIQHKPLFTAERMKPKLEKVSPLAGLKRLFSPTSLVNFAKGVAKLVIVAAVMFLIIWPERSRFSELITYDPAALLPFVRHSAVKLLLGTLSILTIIAGLDFLYQRFTWHKKQRMSMKEIRDEYKQMEGDPTVKAKLRQIRIERGRKRMMAAVPDASVIITNPTHFAVALKYEADMPAPVCVAKGQDAIALKIREIGKEHGVPIVENKPLARALHANVEIDQEIPPDQYKAVAEVIGYVMRLEGKLGAGRNR